jgi:sortase A
MTAVETRAAPERGTVRRALHTLSSVLIVSGLLLLADAGLTVLWQEPISALYNHFQQGKLKTELRQLSAAKPTPLEQKALAALPDERARLAFRARALDRKIQPGQPIGRIHIPSIGLDKIVVEGTDHDDLQKGPGHYPATPLPGAPGTVAIAGHRTTYGAPFRHIDQVKPGARIVVQMPYGTFEYRVERTRIVLPTAVWITNRVGYDRLVLSACHPLYSAARRIVVFARQVRESSAGGLI